MHFTNSSSSQKPCTESDNTTQTKIQELIQKTVATTELYLSLPSYVCAALSILVVGPLTDKYGRKVGFLFPIIGTFMKQIVYAAVVGLHLPPLILVAGHIFESLGGSFAAMLTSMFTVVSDITSPGGQRSFRITIMEALQTLTGAAGGYAIGQWIKHSYFHPIIFSVICSLVSLSITVFLLPETIQTRRLQVPVTVTYPGLCLRIRTCARNVLPSGWQKFKRTFSLFVTDHCEGHGLAKRRLCLVIFILTVAVNFATPGVQSLYMMKSPRCWAATKILTFGSVQILCNWVAILLLVSLMQRVFKLADRHIAVIGVVSSITHAVFMSLAINDVMIYEVAVVGVMIRAIIPMLRSVMSSVVSATDQGAVYASMGCVEILGAAVCGVLANRVYYATLSVWDGSVFVMFACLMIVALALLILLNILFLRDEQRERNEANISRGNIQEVRDPSW
ncbi:hypothetical protein BsWGS_09874 [Bradybaena similaris]